MPSCLKPASVEEGTGVLRPAEAAAFVESAGPS